MECFNKACVLNINDSCGLKKIYVSDDGMCGKMIILEKEEMDVIERKFNFYKEADSILPQIEETKASNVREGGTMTNEITKEQLYQMYIKEGKPSRLIAELMGINESVIKRYIRRWGLTRNAMKSGEKEDALPNPTKRYR